MRADADLGSLAQRTVGFSGADLANVINEAALAAARNGRDAVAASDLEEALDKVVLGARRRLAMGEPDRWRVAVHESGHALVAHELPAADPLEKVTIVPHGRALGVTQQSQLEDRYNLPESYVRARVAVAMGGRAAESLALGEVSSGAENDLEAATGFTRQMVERWGMSKELGPVSLHRDDGVLAEAAPELTRRADLEVLTILRDAEQLARTVLGGRRAALEALARRLMEVETVEGEEVDRIVAASGGAVPAQPSRG
jgi:cell division protease FtsH